MVQRALDVKKSYVLLVQKMCDIQCSLVLVASNTGVLVRCAVSLVLYVQAYVRMQSRTFNPARTQKTCDIRCSVVLVRCAVSLVLYVQAYVRMQPRICTHECFLNCFKLLMCSSLCSSRRRKMLMSSLKEKSLQVRGQYTAHYCYAYTPFYNGAIVAALHGTAACEMAG